MAAGMGHALSKWAAVEATMMQLCGWALGQDDEAMRQLFSVFKTFNLAHEFTGAAMRLKLANNPALVFWISWSEYVRELSGDRNYIAHTPIVAHGEGPPWEADWATAYPMLGTAGFLADAKKPPLETSDVYELVHDFMHAFNEGAEFAQALRSNAALPEKFQQAVARRRASRAERLAKSRKGGSDPR